VPDPVTGPPVSGLDEAITAPELGAHLYRVLVNHGHLNPVDGIPNTAPATADRAVPVAPASGRPQPRPVVHEHPLPEAVPGAPSPGTDEHRDIGRQHRY
jgi:hypothetical protein